MHPTSVSIVLFLLCLLAAAVAALHDNDLDEPLLDKYQLHVYCESGIREQVNEEMHASLTYMSMAAHFDRNSVARKGFSKFFSDNSKDEREHAQKLIDYINRRGGAMTAFNVTMPKKVEWNNALEALEDSLHLEQYVNNKLHTLHHAADKKCKDPHMMDFLEGEFLTEQVESIDSFKRHIAVLKAMDTGMGEYLLDRQLLGEKVEL